MDQNVAQEDERPIGPLGVDLEKQAVSERDLDPDPLFPLEGEETILLDSAELGEQRTVILDKTGPELSPDGPDQTVMLNQSAEYPSAQEQPFINPYITRPPSYPSTDDRRFERIELSAAPTNETPDGQGPYVKIAVIVSVAGFLLFIGLMRQRDTAPAPNRSTVPDSPTIEAAATVDSTPSLPEPRLSPVPIAGPQRESNVRATANPNGGLPVKMMQIARQAQEAARRQQQRAVEEGRKAGGVDRPVEPESTPFAPLSKEEFVPEEKSAEEKAELERKAVEARRRAESHAIRLKSMLQSVGRQKATPAPADE